MERKTLKTKNKLTRWSFASRGNRQNWIRIVLGLGINVVLLIYILPRREHLFDVRDYQYVQIHMPWTFVTAAIPLIGLVFLIPVFRSARPLHRWLAIALSVFPVYLTILEWLQFLSL